VTIKKRKSEFIDVKNLIYEMKMIPSKVRHDGELQSDMEYLEDLSKSKWELCQANISKRYRKKYSRRGEKVTEVQIKELVTTHPDVIKAHEVYIEAKKNASLAKMKFKATLTKGDMVKNIGFMVSKEIEQGAYKINKKKAIASGGLKDGGVFDE
jgi:hypothetical protein